jgi:hypothetical protein
MSDEQRPVWDDLLAQDMLGKTMLVGITHVDSAGERLEQCYGEVISVDRARGVSLRLAGNRGGEVFWLPPDLRSVLLARRGSYRLRSTGEIVENPDYTVAWTIYPKGA